ncbi:MAG TPA: DUF3800 domain-containing protein [Acidimicrobiales bacterium]|nr:DUF3800 domain-containing protein [Acidimicrobiales bacterium]
MYLDDSGKPDTNHVSGAVVIGGFAIDADLYPTFSRRFLGAKGRFFPQRGVPQAWEAKSTDIVKPNPWKRSKNRNFSFEVARIVETMAGTAFSATIIKSRMNHPMTLATTMPLQLQCLVEHFDTECRALGRTGMVVADWSSHHHDSHASQCVASFAASQGLTVHPCVYYASSHSSEGIQAADLIAAVRRRAAEGDIQLTALDQRLAAVRVASPTGLTVRGRTFANWITVF